MNSLATALGSIGTAIADSFKTNPAITVLALLGLFPVGFVAYEQGWARPALMREVQAGYDRQQTGHERVIQLVTDQHREEMRRQTAAVEAVRTQLYIMQHGDMATFR